jgi:hypothetical protein
MLSSLMKPRGTYKLVHKGLANRDLGNGDLVAGRSLVNRGRALDGLLDPLARSEMRCRRILRSLRDEIIGCGGGDALRIRQVFQTPREIYRLELELPELGYQRTTLLDRDALEELLEADEVREIVRSSALRG